jgi:hypothetical protein
MPADALRARGSITGPTRCRARRRAVRGELSRDRGIFLLRSFQRVHLHQGPSECRVHLVHRADHPWYSRQGRTARASGWRAGSRVAVRSARGDDMSWSGSTRGKGGGHGPAREHRYWSSRSGAVFVSALALLGCPGPPSGTASPGQVPGPGGGSPGQPQTCAVREGCRLALLGQTPIPTGHEAPDYFTKLGCGPTYQYWNGSSSALWGAIGTFCPDTAVSILHESSPPLAGYLAGYCETSGPAPGPSEAPTGPKGDATTKPVISSAGKADCIHVPVGEVFVIISIVPEPSPRQGPSCPSTCLPYPVGYPL